MSLLPNLRARALGKPVQAPPQTPPQIIAATLEQHFQSAMRTLTGEERKHVSVALMQETLKRPFTECFLHVKANLLPVDDRVGMFHAIATQLLDDARTYARELGNVPPDAPAETPLPKAVPYEVGLRVLTRWVQPPMAFEIGTDGVAVLAPPCEIEAQVAGMTPASAE